MFANEKHNRLWQKKQLRELSDEELKNVTGGYLCYVEPYIDDLVVVEPFEPIIVVDPIFYKDSSNVSCPQGQVASTDGTCVPAEA